MAKSDIISIMQTRNVSPFDFNFDMMMAPPLNCLIHPQDGWDIYELAHSIKYASKLDYKLKCIDQILKYRGFTKMLAGTNRVIYKCMEDTSFLLKVSFDRSSLSDNFGEYENQWKLKPFIPKTFEVHPSGSIGLQERVQPIRRMSEFIEIADDIFDIITNNFIGKYILEDIGSQFFMNWGIRKGFGPVLLDYPYCYELDGNKLYCNNVDMTSGIACNGVIDYDDGFNFLVCPFCGKRYSAKELSSAIKSNIITVKGGYKMKVKIMKGDKVYINPVSSSDIIEPPSLNISEEPKPFSVEVVRGEETLFRRVEEKQDEFDDYDDEDYDEDEYDDEDYDEEPPLDLKVKIVKVSSENGEEINDEKTSDSNDVNEIISNAQRIASEARRELSNNKRSKKTLSSYFIEENDDEESNVEIHDVSGNEDNECHDKIRRDSRGRILK